MGQNLFFTIEQSIWQSGQTAHKRTSSTGHLTKYGGKSYVGQRTMTLRWERHHLTIDDWHVDASIIVLLDNDDGRNMPKPEARCHKQILAYLIKHSDWLLKVTWLVLTIITVQHSYATLKFVYDIGSWPLNGCGRRRLMCERSQMI